jgi:hypothetical protein
MTSINDGMRAGGFRREVDQRKLDPALLIASSLVLAIRTARWNPTHSDGLATSICKKKWNTAFVSLRSSCHTSRAGIPNCLP